MALEELALLVKATTAETALKAGEKTTLPHSALLVVEELVELETATLGAMAVLETPKEEQGLLLQSQEAL
jgi:hypothetical protein